MSDTNNAPDTHAIEEEITRSVSSSFARRPKIIPAPDEHSEPGSRVQAAMNAVDRKIDLEALHVEAFIDQAIHARIVAVRGGYAPGPRDAYVRRMVLEAVNSISHSNSHTLDR